MKLKAHRRKKVPQNYSTTFKQNLFCLELPYLQAVSFTKFIGCMCKTVGQQEEEVGHPI